MNKQKLIVSIANKTGLTQKKVKTIVDGIFEFILKNVQDNRDLNIHNFGRFELKTRKARKGVNPRTGDVILIPPKDTIVFKPSKNLTK